MLRQTDAKVFKKYSQMKLQMPAYRFQYMTGPRSFILGASVEGRLSDRFSIEANVLHRPMKRTINFTEFHADGSTIAISDTATAFRAWEFPVMLKYTLPVSRFSGRARPLLAVGPSFRTQDDASATEPSQFGISPGVGAAIRLGRFRLAPSVRYAERLLPIVSGIKWSDKFNGLRVVINNRQEFDYEQLNIVLRPDVPVVAIAQENGSDCVFSDAVEPTVDAEIFDLDTKERFGTPSF